MKVNTSIEIIPIKSIDSTVCSPDNNLDYKYINDYKLNNYTL